MQKARVPTGLLLMVSKIWLRQCMFAYTQSNTTKVYQLRKSLDDSWYALAYLTYMVRASLAKSRFESGDEFYNNSNE